MLRTCQLLMLACALTVLSATGVLAAPAEAEEIPPLRPPLKKMPPTFWEAHGIQAVAAAAGGIVIVAGICAVALRRRKALPLSPEEEARAALRIIQEQHPDDLSGISQVTRRCLASLLRLPGWEMTTAEFCGALKSGSVSDEHLPDKELPEKVCAFLHRCDAQKFAPGPPEGAWDAAGEALELIEEVINRSKRREQREEPQRHGGAEE